jgi:hypothetical protein
VSWGLLQSLPFGHGVETLTAYSVQIGVNDTVGSIQEIPSGLVPFATDQAGDQVLAPPAWQVFSVPGGVMGVAVRPAGGGADEPAPWPSGLVATATPIGRGAALVWNATPTRSGTLALSVWRP